GADEGCAEPATHTLAKNLSPSLKPPPYSPSRPRTHGRKRNERLGGIGSGPLAVASAEAETFPAPAHGTVEGVPGKPGGDWPQHERTTRPKIPDAWGDDRFILTNTARGVHRPMPSQNRSQPQRAPRAEPALASRAAPL